MHSRRPSILHRRATPRRQRGVVMFIALIVMVALSLAAIALIRSVDTTTTVIGNLAFRLASVQPANAAVESAAAALFQAEDVNNAVRISDLTHNNSAENYYATRQPSEDPATGIPLVLLTRATAIGLTKVFIDNSTNNTIQYVIERMCLPAADGQPASLTLCDMIQPKQITGETIGDPTNKLPSVPFYRVTVRVDGPQHTTSFLQAMLR